MLPEETLSILELDENLADCEKPPEPSPGRYVAEVQDVSEATSQRGNDYYAIRWVIPPTELPANVAEFYEDGYVMFWNRIIKPRGKGDARAKYNLRKFVETLGLDTRTSSIDPNEWMGQRATLVCVVGKDQDGNPRLEIKSIEPLNSAPPRAQKEAATPTRRGRR